MTTDLILIFAILAVALVLFIHGRWRYDIVAMLALLAVVLTELIPASTAFSGFGNPAVITVACVLIITRAFRNAGLVDRLAEALSPLTARPTSQVGVLAGLVAAFSAIMNNVGALALMMPVAHESALERGRPASRLLMPIAFASLLGGMITLIGTPPNIIVATFRAETAGAPFAMFDFTPVGLGIAVVGILYITLVGWRLIPPDRQGETTAEQLFKVEGYVYEARVPADSPIVGQPLDDLERLGQFSVAVVALIRGQRRILAPSGRESLAADDVLVLEGDPDSLKRLVDGAKLELAAEGEIGVENLRSDEVGLVEAVVGPGAAIEGNSPQGLMLHARFGINLLGIARRGQAITERLGRVRFQPGDVLLLQGPVVRLGEVISSLGCLPLAERGLRLARPAQPLLPLGVFAIAVLMSALGLVAVHIAFVAAVVALILLEVLSVREAYAAIEWPVIVLLGAMIPVGEALRATGGTDLIAQGFVSLSTQLPVTGILVLLLVVTMLITDAINNAATAVLMAPIGVGVAQGLGVNPDTFLMAVAVGASSTFLTPIGHQSNALVMGPGGYAFGDYWRMGLPLDILIVAVATPLLLFFWPL
ncbi:MAG: SLC13 family permease [Alphaproteobacteria bacterium]